MTVSTARLKRLEQALDELGALTADGIADRMRALGIKGRRKVTCRCVLAKHFAALGLSNVLVAPASIQTPEGWVAWFLGSDDQEVALPPTVAEFARHFDDGVYLDLVGPVADA